MPQRELICTLWALWALVMTPWTCRAGGGPENLFLVVNSRSWASKTIANHYCKFRSVPDSNVFHLDWSGPNTKISVERFRQEILKPIVKEIENRKLAKQIDYVVYSADFPYLIGFGDDVKGQRLKFAAGSITGMTYLYPWVLASDPRYTGLTVNWYASTDPTGQAPSRGFDNRQFLAPGGKRIEAGGQRYWLSMMLAYTSGRGNSVDEAVESLRRSVSADGTRPPGTIYFMRHKDKRSVVRHHLYGAIAETIKGMGVRAEVLDGFFPDNKSDVMGAVVGKAQHAIGNANMTFLPGAICDNFTSFGGVFAWNRVQTPLTAFIRLGAAGASGTVIEPFANLAKFPHPILHVHYVRGCTLAESYYQSVTGPLQLLIVGDPLCAPWAASPRVGIEEASPRIDADGTFVVTPKPGGLQPIGRHELFIDGRLVSKATAGNQFKIETPKITDGYHEIRVVAVDDSPLENRGRKILPLVVDHRNQRVVLKMQTPPQLPIERNVQVSASCPGASFIVVTHQRRELARINGENGNVQFPASLLGQGPVTMQAIALVKLENAEPRKLPYQRVFSEPLHLEITPGLPYAPVAGAGSRLKLTKKGGSPIAITASSKPSWLERAGVRRNERFVLEADVDAPRPGTHQLQIYFQGEVTVSLNDKQLFSERSGTPTQFYVPTALAAGHHRLRIEGQVSDTGAFEAQFGMRGTSPLGEPLQ